MANATRSRSSSPVVRKKTKLDMKKFTQAYLRCVEENLGVQDVAHQLGWHVDEVLRAIRETNELFAMCGQASLPSLRNR